MVMAVYMLLPPNTLMLYTYDGRVCDKSMMGKSAMCDWECMWWRVWCGI